jgi:hypothetical protein
MLPPSLPPSRSPQRWCSGKKATKALSTSGMGPPRRYRAMAYSARILALIQKIEAADAAHFARLRESAKKETTARAATLLKKRASLPVAQEIAARRGDMMRGVDARRGGRERATVPFGRRPDGFSGDADPRQGPRSTRQRNIRRRVLHIPTSMRRPGRRLADRPRVNTSRRRRGIRVR